MIKPSEPPSSNDPAIDPVALSRQGLKTPPRQRFYTSVAAARLENEAQKIESGENKFQESGDGSGADSFTILLDGRPVLTPAKVRLAVPTRAAAEAVAAEWRAQKETIDPATMPLTRILNAAIDGVAHAMPAVAAEIVNFAGTDLVCYRAEGPESLQRAQAAAWDPILAFAEADMGARFFCAEGIIHVAQPEESLIAVRAAIDRLIGKGAGAPIALACLNVMTTLTGSALIALARASGAIGLDAAWAAAHVDEDFEMRLWGADAEAMARRAQRFSDMDAADRLFGLQR